MLSSSCFFFFLYRKNNREHFNYHKILWPRRGAGQVPPSTYTGQHELPLPVHQLLILSVLPSSLSCKRCIIVGNGGILFNKSLGSRIDEYDVVVR